jgi:hypothetical protein
MQQQLGIKYKKNTGYQIGLSHTKVKHTRAYNYNQSPRVRGRPGGKNKKRRRKEEEKKKKKRRTKRPPFDAEWG